MEVFIKNPRNLCQFRLVKQTFRLDRSHGLSSASALHHTNARNDVVPANISLKCGSWKQSDNLKVICMMKPAHRLKHYRSELKGISTLLKRSEICSTHDLYKFCESRRYFSSSNKNEDGKDENKEKKSESDQDPTHGLFRAGLLLSVIIASYMMAFGQEEKRKPPEFISWNEFYYDMLAKGEVASIVVHRDFEFAAIQLAENAVIKGKKVNSQTPYRMKIIDIDGFEMKVRQAEKKLGLRPDQAVGIQYRSLSALETLLPQGVLILIGVLILRYLFKRVKLPNPTDMFSELSERKAKFVRVDIASKHGHGISFKDVAGLTEAKQEIMEFVDYIKSPQRFKMLGAKIPRGALLLGPPGCGKTLLARAVASESGVPFLAMAGSEFVEILGGLGASRVRDLFAEARKRAPCIVYIDEIDAIGRKRTGGAMGSNMEDEQTLNQLLVEMDGIGTREGVIMLGATNRADILDKALLRPGRFDRHIMIDLPTLIERRQIFNLYLSKLKLQGQPDTYSPRMAQMTPGMSGADISNICNEAAIHAGRIGKTIIDQSDFEYAIERVIAGVEKKTRLMSPTEKRVVAYHESGHALVGWMLKYTDALLRVSIVPRTNSTLGFAQYMPSDQKLYSTEELFEKMCMALGGRAAESVIFNHTTTGAQDDLKKVTKMAYDQISCYGLNETVGTLSFPTEAEGQFTKPYSRKLQATIDEEAQMLVARAFNHTVKVLQENKEKLHKLANTLLEKEVMSYEDIEALIGPPPHGQKNRIEPHGWEGIMPSNDNSQSPQPRQTSSNSSP